MRGRTAFVYIDRPPGGFDTDTVLLDDAGGARRAVEHLLAHGHRRIACVADRSEVYTARARVAGYEAALQAAGVELDPDLIRPELRRGPRRGRRLRAARPARGSPPQCDLHGQQPQHGRRAARARRTRGRGGAGRLRRLRARRPARHHGGARGWGSARRAGRRAGVRPARRRRPAAPARDDFDRARRPRLRGAAGVTAAPLVLPPNQFHRFYARARGSTRCAACRPGRTGGRRTGSARRRRRSAKSRRG